MKLISFTLRVKELRKDKSEDTHSPRPVTVHGTDSRLWPPPSDSAAMSGKLLPRVVIEVGEENHYISRFWELLLPPFFLEFERPVE